MEFRRIRTYKYWFRIQALILLVSSLCSAASIKTISLESGLSGSISYTDYDGAHFGAGTGYQYGLYSVWDIKKDWELSVSIQNITLEQALYTRADVSNTESIQHLQQKWTLLGVGAQWTKDFWFYEYAGGFAIGDNSQIGLDTETASSNKRTNLRARTTNFFFVGASIGYQKEIYKRWNVVSRLQTFFVLDSIYKTDGFDDNFFAVLPFMFNIGFEYNY